MPSSYTPSLRLTLPVTGELAGTWGDTVNTGITNLVDASVAGTAAVTMTDADYTLTSVNGATDEARKMFVTLTGTLTAARNVICPAASKLYFIKNTTTGGFAVTLKTSAGTGISVPNGKSMVLYCDATNVVDATNHYSSITIANALAATSGGTGQASYTTGDLLYASSSTALSKLGVGTAGQVLTSSGTAPQWSTLSGVAVTTFSAGTTGFTPSTATSGAITLAGTLATTNGGTGLTSFTSGGVVYASSTSALATVTALNFDGTTLSSVGAGDRVRFGTGSRNIYIAGDSGGVSLFDGAGQTGNGWYISGASSYVAGYIGSSEQMRLTSTGLGIGTSSPASTLDVNGIIGTSASGGTSITFKTSGTSNYSFANQYPSAGNFSLYDHALATSVLTVNSGNLGIGTSSPSAKLDVNGSAQLRAGGTFLLLNSDNTNSYYIQNNGVTGAGNPVLDFIQNGVGTRVRLDASGNLGIGTSSPGTRLEVSGTSGTSAQATIAFSDTAQFGGLVFKNVATTVGGVYAFGTASTGTYGYPNSSMRYDAVGAHIWTDTTNERMRLTGAGNLGIGTSSPVYKLDVSDSAAAAVLRVNTSNSGISVSNYSEIQLADVGTTRTYWRSVRDGTGSTIFSFNDNWVIARLGSEVGRWTSTGLGIGTSSPATKLHVNTGAAGYGITVAASSQTASTYQIGIDSNSGLAIYDSAAAAQRLVLSNSGNLGLGVTPQVWGSNYRAIEVAGATSGNLVAYVNALNIGTGFRNDNTNFIYTNSIQAPTWYGQNLGAHRWYTAPVGTTGNTISFTNVMTLDASGNLGIGTSSPGAKLDVFSSGATLAKFTRDLATDATLQIGADNDGPIIEATGVNTLRFFTSSSEKMRLDSSGNLGLGVTPSAWGSGWKAFDVGSSQASLAGAGNNLYLNANSYYNGTSWIYKTGSYAQMYQMSSGQHQWYIAPVGTSGNAITFTQAMTLDANGNLNVGTNGIPVNVFQKNSTNYSLATYNAHATSPLGFNVFYAATAPNGTGSQFIVCNDTVGIKFEVRSNGGIGNFSANDVNLSDVRTKKDIQDAPSYLNRICAIPVRTFLYKDQTDEQLNLGVIAQEVEAQCPELVDNSGFGTLPEDGVPLKAIYQTDLQYALMKCIQEQQALIESLTARVAQLESKP